MKTQVEFSRNAQKDLRKLPPFIIDSLKLWIHYVENLGIGEVRKIRGYNDEALKGFRLGQRSARLNRSYRLIYREKETGSLEILIIAINKHKY